MDYTDKHIINALTKNSRITMKELGEKVHLTGPAAAARVAKLEDNGIIEGYSIKVNYSKLGLATHVMINIFTHNFHHQAYLEFVETQREFVINNYKISGEGCFLLECRFPSNEVLDNFLVELNKHVNYKLTIIINKL